MKKLVCGYCRKAVRDKPWLGTLHFCLDADRRALVDMIRAQQNAPPPPRFEEWLSGMMSHSKGQGLKGG
jgi:hypothetical protein